MGVVDFEIIKSASCWTLDGPFWNMHLRSKIGFQNITASQFESPVWIVITSRTSLQWTPHYHEFTSVPEANVN